MVFLPHGTYLLIQLTLAVNQWWYESNPWSQEKFVHDPTSSLHFAFSYKWHHALTLFLLMFCTKIYSRKTESLKGCFHSLNIYSHWKITDLHHPNSPLGLFPLFDCFLSWLWPELDWKCPTSYHSPIFFHLLNSGSCVIIELWTWEKSRVSRENPHRHGEDMQTLQGMDLLAVRWQC